MSEINFQYVVSNEEDLKFLKSAIALLIKEVALRADFGVFTVEKGYGSNFVLIKPTYRAIIEEVFLDRKKTRAKLILFQATNQGHRSLVFKIDDVRYNVILSHEERKKQSK